MLSLLRGASTLNLRSTLIDTVARGRRSRRSCSRFSATNKRGPMLALTPNGPVRKIRRWSLVGDLASLGTVPPHHRHVGHCPRQPRCYGACLQAVGWLPPPSTGAGSPN